MESERGSTVCIGDVLKIERRLVVNGVLTTLTDKGLFQGVELVGATEHIVLADRRKKAVRLFPLGSVSEITVLKATRREAPAPEAAPPAPRWDPSFA